ncbi:hypothetical protein OHA18_05985 [Kribbella sp. NBC_00709]|uniref:hypothetical protein n=1 Tax=Kribbella sp. NBC_00709 TaxID=2975972 RepID=UPI002E2C02D8|nr:hypothetical protein [Kribbella sp. NBC_00709]
MLDSGWPVLGRLLVVGYVGVAGLLAWQLATQRPAIVVDHQGIHHGRTYRPSAPGSTSC